MGNSPLATYRHNDADTYGKRTHKIDTVSIHCFVGQVTGRRGADALCEKAEASANYIVGYDGTVAVNVDEDKASVCTSNKANDNRAVTIEVACDAYAPHKVTSAAYQTLIELLVDICKRNGIKELKWKADKTLIGQVDKQNMTVHRWFANKACPGDYLYNKHGEISKVVNSRLKIEPQESDDMVRYKTLDEIPKAYKAETEELMKLGFNGKGGTAGLDVTEDMLRCMIINLRTAKALTQAVRPQISEEEMVAFLKEHLSLDIRG